MSRTTVAAHQTGCKCNQCTILNLAIQNDIMYRATDKKIAVSERFSDLLYNRLGEVMYSMVDAEGYIMGFAEEVLEEAAMLAINENCDISDQKTIIRLARLIAKLLVAKNVKVKKSKV